MSVGRACGVSSAGSDGASVWGQGALGAALCCPGCGLFGDGDVCEICMLGAYGGDKHNSCMMHGMNSSELRTQRNLRVVRSREDEQGTKLLPSSSLLQVGSPIVGNTPVIARLADYLRWTPRRWPVEAWERRYFTLPVLGVWLFQGSAGGAAFGCTRVIC